MRPTPPRPTPPSGCATSSPTRPAGPNRPPACSTRSSPASTASRSRRPGYYYQAGMTGPRGLVTIGTFHLRGGPGTVELWSAVNLADYPTITVTREPEDGDPASSGQVVLTSHL